tara:strand:- start:1739 stop:1978 length:240 start_codon:yes stop_codon:yes gene_type:complete
MKAKIFLNNYLISKVGKKRFKLVMNEDLIAQGIIDSLDIVTLCMLIKKKFKIDIKFNDDESVNLFRSYNKILSKIHEKK